MATLQVSHDIKADPHVVWSIVIGMDDWVDVIEAIESEQPAPSWTSGSPPAAPHR